MTTTESIAHNIKTLRQLELPLPAIDCAKMGVLDTFGAMLGGATHDASKILQRVALSDAAQGPALVYGTNQRTSVLEAALVNGVSSHILDYDDSNARLHGHASVAILSPTISVAEEISASGADVLRAYVIGIETCSRLGRGVSRHQYTSGWHPTTSVGIFGAVASCAHLLNLSENEIAIALGIAASMASGLKANFGTMTKALNVGHSARGALLAVRLAHQGFTSSLNAFDHNHGYLNVFNRGPENYDVDRITSDWANPLSLVEFGLQTKRYPCCFACLPVIDSFKEISDRHYIAVESISRIEVAVHPIRFPHINVPCPSSALQAKFSAHYCLAKYALQKVLSVEDFEDEAHLDPAVQHLMQLVVLEAEELESTGGAKVTVTLVNGTRYENCVPREKPLTRDGYRSKFLHLAERALQKEAARELLDLMEALDDLPSFSLIPKVCCEGLTPSSFG
jgi:2-methylcitrate dehydratase PrpD